MYIYNIYFKNSETKYNYVYGFLYINNLDS